MNARLGGNFTLQNNVPAWTPIVNAINSNIDKCDFTQMIMWMIAHYYEERFMDFYHHKMTSGDYGIVGVTSGAHIS